MVEFSSVIAGVRFAQDALNALIRGKVESESQGKILEALAKLSATQEALFEMRTEMFALQEENSRLRRDLEQSTTWTEQLGKYELVKAPGGDVVHKFKGEPEHFVCSSCINGQELQILQMSANGKFRCAKCKASYQILPYRPSPPIQARRDHDPFVIKIQAGL